MKQKLIALYASYANHFAIRKKPGEKLLTFLSWKRLAAHPPVGGK